MPLPARVVRQIRDRIAALRFDRVYGGWAVSIMSGDARAKVLRSAERYVAALEA